MKEFELIKKLASQLHQSPDGTIGVGDDCAVVKSDDRSSLLYCIDTLVDSVHFDRKISNAYDIGYKAAAVNLSDIAAMGGSPKYLLISLQLPKKLPDPFVSQMYQGIESCIRPFGAFVLGGDTTSSSVFAISVVAIGEVKGDSLLRSGAVVGQNLFVTGVIGEAWAGLSFARGELSEDLLADSDACLTRHKRPSPQIEFAQKLHDQGLATAAIDISDGLLAEARHIAEASDVSIELFLEKIPLPFTTSVLDLETKMAAISGGDDYQLLFTSNSDLSQLRLELGEDFPVYYVGNVKERGDAAVRLYSSVDNEEILLNDRALGYQHG